MQLVELRETVETAPAERDKGIAAKPSAKVAKPKLFDNLRKLELMAFGVPAEWVDEVRTVDEDTLFDVLEKLPQEAQEQLLRLAVGEKAEPVKPAEPEADPFTHPDAQRRFRIISNADELRLALDYPWEKWTVFLHPSQEALVRRTFSGPARVSGSAGTGKTIVALHRAVHLARTNPEDEILLTTFSRALANALHSKLKILVSAEPSLAPRITVKAIADVGVDLYTQRYGKPGIASAGLIDDLIGEAASKVPSQSFATRVLRGEWHEVVDAWQIRSWEAYRDVPRLGRKTRLGIKQRELLWEVFSRVRSKLEEQQLLSISDVFARLTDDLAASKAEPTFDFAVVDECQDLGVAEARFLKQLTAGRADGLLFTGDLGQRIFQQPFSWKSLGIDVRGRSSTLRINYRTSHQIRVHADRLLPKAVSDVDGNTDSRDGTVSMFDGPAPLVLPAKDSKTEVEAVANWLRARHREGVRPEEIGVFVRSDEELPRARSALDAADLKYVELAEDTETQGDAAALSTMHLAKGLEFKAVVVMACDEGVIPSEERLVNLADPAELEETYNTERHLLYVACTRARDFLLVSGIQPMSEFIEDFKMEA
jgi:superfamily I DNA/RNA helicase